MPWLFFLSALAIPAFYAVGLLWHWVRDFLRTPSGFPDTVIVRHSSDGPEPVPRRPAHSRYRSDRIANATNRHHEEKPS